MDQTQTFIPALVRQGAKSHPAETILRTKDRGIWKAVTWTQLDAHVSQIGAALLSFGFGRGDVAAVLSETRLEAAYADVAILGSGAASVAICPEAEPDRVCHILSSSGARLIFVENEEQLDKVLQIRDRCPALARIVVFDMKGLREFADPMVISLEAFGKGPEGGAWGAAVQTITADQPAVIQFPRGDAGGSGRVLTHGDLTHMVQATGARLAIRSHDERLAVLRLVNITERVWGLYLGLATRCISNFPERPDTVFENLQELQPTVLGADAEAWDRLHALATRRAQAATRTQRMIYEWGLRSGKGGGAGRMLANVVVLHAVRREFGLSRLRLAYVGGTTVSPAALDWAKSLGIAIQRLDEPLLRSGQVDERYQTLMQNAYA
jgi:long-chain acyl-CoA synthetase